jgi:putative transcriptional regulator
LVIDTVSNKIREHRFKNGEMTQRELGGRVGVSRQTMNAIENCRHAPSINVAIRIADVFYVSVDQMFELDYEGKPARRELAQPDRAATVAVDQPHATGEKSIEIESRQVPLEEKPTHQASLASLRNIIGS